MRGNHGHAGGGAWRSRPYRAATISRETRREHLGLILAARVPAAWWGSVTCSRRSASHRDRRLPARPASRRSPSRTGFDWQRVRRRAGGAAVSRTWAPGWRVRRSGRSSALCVGQVAVGLLRNYRTIAHVRCATARRSATPQPCCRWSHRQPATGGLNSHSERLPLDNDSLSRGCRQAVVAVRRQRDDVAPTAVDGADRLDDLLRITVP